MAYSVAGKRVLITGASSGLGAALARQLAAQQAAVGLVARRRARLAERLADCQRTSPDSAMWVADLADAGAVGAVALVARRRARLAGVLTDCQRTSPDSAMWVADLADAGAVGEVALQAWDGLGGVDVLINNPAIPKRRPVTELEPDEVEAVMRLDFFAPMRMTLALLGTMLASVA